MSDLTIVSSLSGRRYRLGQAFRIGERQAHEARLVDKAPHVLGESYWVKQVPANNPAAIARLRYEAVMLEKLSHPALIRLVDRGRNKACFFLVLESATGRTLQELIEAGPLSARQVLVIALELADLLVYLHSRRIICRTLPPTSIYMDPQGRAKLTDLSAAWDEVSPTNSGEKIEWALYISPEQASGAKAERASDIYVYGLLLFELLAGRPPFQGNHRNPLILQHVLEPPPDIRTLQADVPPELAAIVSRCLEKQKARRYPDATALLTALRAVQLTGSSKGTWLNRLSSLVKDQAWQNKGKK